MYGLDIFRDAWIYALAAHEYYHGDGHTQIMTDMEYDALTIILKNNWFDIPQELKVIFKEPKRLGQGSNHIFLDEEQYFYASEIYKEYKCQNT